MGSLADLLRDPSGNFIDQSRPVIQNPDGSISTERTITVEVDGKYYLIPTIVNGKILDPKKAISLFNLGSNKPVGVFNSSNEAHSAAIQRSKRIGEIYGPANQDPTFMMKIQDRMSGGHGLADLLQPQRPMIRNEGLNMRGGGQPPTQIPNAFRGPLAPVDPNNLEFLPNIGSPWWQRKL